MLQLLKNIFVKIAFAQSIGGSGNNGTDLPNPLGTTSAAAVLQKIITYLITISIPIVTIMVLIGAFQILFAGGDTEKFTTGRRTIIYAAVGFAIVLAGTGIIAIIKQLLST